MKTEEQIKKAAKNRAYRELNKETLRLKRIIKEENEEVKLNIKNTNKDWYLRNKEKEEREEDANVLMTTKAVARLIGVKENMVRKIILTDSYKMPKAKMTLVDGSKLYCREEIKEWMPFIREVVAFYSAKKKIIVLTGAAAHIVNFMRKNSAVMKHCEKWERSRNVKAGI